MAASYLVSAARHEPAPAAALQAPDVIDAEFTEASPRHLREYLRVLYKYRWLAVTIFGLTLGLTVLVTLLTPRLYTAATRLQVARQSPIQLRLDENVLRLDDNDRNVNGSSSFLSTQVATLRSRDLAERVIRGWRLAENEAFLRPAPQREGLVWVGGRMLNLLRPRGWDGAQQGALDADGASGQEVGATLLDRYMRYLAVQDVRGTDLIEVRFTTPSPQLSAFLAATHTQAYMQSGDEARLATNVTAKDFLERQLRESREHVERSEMLLARFAAEHPNVAVNQEQKVLAQRIGDVSELLTKAEAHRLGLQSRYEFLNRADADPLAYFLDRPGVQKLRLAILDLRAQRAAVSDRLGPNHPQMIELRRQEAEVSEQLRAEVGAEVAAVRSQYDAARMREEELRQKLGQEEQLAIELRELGTRYDLLKGDVESAHALHGSLLKQQKETAVNSQLAPSNIRVVERAEVPQRPSRPNVPVNLTLGVLAGLVLAAGGAFVCEYFDNSVKSSDDVAELLQLPTLATIPNFALARRRSAERGLGRLLAKPDGDLPAGPTYGAPGATQCLGEELVVFHEPWSPVAESFRALRTAVLFSAPDAPPKVILVTSAGAGEGKTVSSLNLATALADSGSRVLVLDVDLRRPSCHRALGIENDRGLSNFLAGQLPLESVTHVLDAPRLSFIPAGPTPPNPAELVGSARMRQALAELREQYDFLIVDSPPVTPVTDSIVLARDADGVVLVVKGHDTPRELVRRARDQLALAGARVLGAVVNNVDLGWGDLYFYNRYYGRYCRETAAEALA